MATGNTNQNKANQPTAEGEALKIRGRFYLPIKVVVGLCMVNIVLYNTGFMRWFSGWTEISFFPFNLLWSGMLFIVCLIIMITIMILERK